MVLGSNLRLVLLSVLILSSCNKSYDLGDRPVPEVTVDTSSVSWENGVENVVKTKCLSCHTPSKDQYVPANTPAYLDRLNEKDYFNSLRVIIRQRVLDNPGDPMPPRFATPLTENEKAALRIYLNQHPVLTTIGSRTASVGNTLSFSVSGSDGDSSTLFYTSSSSGLTGNVYTDGASFDPTTRIFSWNPTMVGVYNVTFNVKDGNPNGNIDSETVLITVTNNQAPTIAAIGNRSVSVNNPITFSISATDPEGDSISYTSSSTGGSGDVYALGATFNPSTRVFSWTPTSQGVYNVRFTALDNGSPGASSSQNITITVAPNLAPVLAVIGNKSIGNNNALSFTINASDPDGNGLSYSSTSAGGGGDVYGLGATFNPTSRVFSWTPTTVGTYYVTFSVVDNGTPNMSDAETIMINVFNVVTYTQVASILQTKCASCHHPSASAGVNFSNHTNTTNTNAINLGTPTSSRIYIRSGSAASPMPPGGLTLTAQERQNILDWISAGAPNN